MVLSQKRLSDDVIRVTGAFDNVGGHPTGAREWANALEAAGANVQYNRRRASTNPLHSDTSRKRYRYVYDADYHFSHGSAGSLWSMAFEDKVPLEELVMSVTFEAQPVPQRYAQTLDMVREVVVPTEFVADAIAAHGVESSVVREPLDVQTFRPMPLKDEDEPYRFLCVAGDFPYKRLDDLVATFKRVRDGVDEDVELWVKTWTDSRFDLEEHVSKWKGLDENVDGVNYVRGEKPKSSMSVLYNRADCFVLPSMGEGFNRPCAEAAACGLPVIVTGWSGPTEYLPEDDTYLIDYSLGDPPKITPYLPFMDMARPDVDHLYRLMADIPCCDAPGARHRDVSDILNYETVGRQALDVITNDDDGR